MMIKFARFGADSSKANCISRNSSEAWAYVTTNYRRSADTSTASRWSCTALNRALVSGLRLAGFLESSRTRLLGAECFSCPQYNTDYVGASI